VDDEAGRAELAERFRISQKSAQQDPWSERAQGKYEHEYTPLMQVS